MNIPTVAKAACKFPLGSILLNSSTNQASRQPVDKARPNPIKNMPPAKVKKFLAKTSTAPALKFTAREIRYTFFLPNVLESPPVGSSKRITAALYKAILIPIWNKLSPFSI